MSLSNLTRLCSILRTVAKYRITDTLPRKAIPRTFMLAVWLCGIGCRKVPRVKSGNNVNHLTVEQAKNVRLALQELGPIHIKLGQLISTRRDLIPPELADELAILQDKVPPFSTDQSKKIIESSLGYTLEDIFESFDEVPLASASIAQVHSAILKEKYTSLEFPHRNVVVKVVRPHIEKSITQDINLFYKLATILERHSDLSRRLHLLDIVKDYDFVIHTELNLRQEAANASLLKRNFSSNAHLKNILHIPEMHWDFSTTDVLIMQRMFGHPVSAIETLLTENTNMKLLAERGVEIFFTQVFEHNFFHADMHPGNVFVDNSTPDNPRYIALDCAIMGSLSDTDRYFIARILLGAMNRDYPLVSRMFVEAKWIPESVSINAFEAVIRRVCEPVFSKPLGDISFGNVLIDIFQAAQDFGMEVQPQLVLLQKTIINIEGLGQQLYPDLDLWKTADPFLKRWTKQRYSAKRLINNIKENLPSVIETAPMQIKNLLNAENPNSFNEINQQLKTLVSLNQRINKTQQSLFYLLLIISGAGASAIIFYFLR